MTQTAPSDNVVSVGCWGIEGQLMPKIDPGDYDLTFDYYETKLMWKGKSPKLILWFKISLGNKFQGIRIPRYYNVFSLKGSPRKYGDFKIGRSSSFLREYVSLFGMPKRLDRVPMTPFRNVIIRGRVKTVDKGQDQRRIPDVLHYSVVNQLLKVKKL